MGLSFIIPIYFLSKNLSYLKKIMFSLPTFFMLLYILKNILIFWLFDLSVHSLCFESFKWSNIEETKKMEIEAEAWSKTVKNKNQNLNIEDFSKNLNWLEAWKSNHLNYILKLITPFIIFLLIIFLYQRLSL